MAGGMRLNFVFVSACFSRKAGEAFASAGVPHVVCVSIDAKVVFKYSLSELRPLQLHQYIAVLV